MPAVEKLVFDFKEIVTALLKKEGIHEGIWMIYVEFGLAAVNAPVQRGASPKDLAPEELLENIMPTAIVPIQKIGIQRADRLSNIAVDAAVVNPKVSSTPTRKPPKKK